MDTKQVENLARIKRSYNLLQEVHSLLEKAGQPDICATLYLPLGLMEERFDLASLTEVGAAIARKNVSSAEN